MAAGCLRSFAKEEQTRLRMKQRLTLRAIGRRLPPKVRRLISRRYTRLKCWPPVGMVRFGSLRRQTPISRDYGFDRGQPIDRYYIESFLNRHASNSNGGRSPVQGRVLEIAEALYAPRFSRPGDVERLDILDLSPTNPRATIVADLTRAPQLEADAFDCVICTQTIHLIYDLRAAVATLHRILKPRGILLVTVPGISQICRAEMDTIGDHWRFTSRSVKRLFEEVFCQEDVTVQGYGNVLTATAFLYGLCTRDVRNRELAFHDPDYEMLIGVKATKQGIAALES